MSEQKHILLEQLPQWSKPEKMADGTNWEGGRKGKSSGWVDRKENFCFLQLKYNRICHFPSEKENVGLRLHCFINTQPGFF